MDVFIALGVLARALPEDDEARRALGVVATAVADLPPAPLGASLDGVDLLAKHIAKMGRVPLPDSRGLEWLLLRWVAAAEEMTALLREALAQTEGAAAPPVVAGRVAVDEFYQPGYCDDCGATLPPLGVCLDCTQRGEL